MTPDEMIEVIQAYKDGKQIQARGYIFEKGDENKWIDTKNPIWDFSQYDYRIKPESVGIPATEEEITRILSWGIVMKSKKDGNLAVPIGYRKEECKEHFPDYYTLNPNTKCWEEWSEE